MSQAPQGQDHARTGPRNASSARVGAGFKPAPTSPGSAARLAYSISVIAEQIPGRAENILPIASTLMLCFFPTVGRSGACETARLTPREGLCSLLAQSNAVPPPIDNNIPSGVQAHMSMIKFTANNQDLSTDRGYQFKFFCDKCGNGYMSHFQSSVAGTAGGLLRAAGDMFGGILSSAGNSAYEIQRAVGGKAHDAAFEKAVDEAKGYFKQCSKCGRWVCPEVCWNAKVGLCEQCAPDFEESFAAAKAQAMANAAQEQLSDKARQTDYTSGVDMKSGATTPAATLSCPTCGAKTAGAKFCGECGSPLKLKLTCPGCGFEPEGTPKFCPECGVKLPTWK